MPTLNEPYIAVLEGTQNGQLVTYGDPKVIAASTEIEAAKAEALRWAVDMHKRVGKKARLSLKSGNKGILSHVFEEIDTPRS
jgi:hypothetical protein